MLEIKTEDQIYEDLDSYATDECPQITNRARGGVFRSILAIVAKGLAYLYQQISGAIDMALADTSEGEYLGRIAQGVGISRKQAQKTKGYVVFGRHQAGGDVNIPKGTIVSTETDSSGNRYRYMTTSDATLAAGELTVSVEVEAENAGVAYNAGAHTITVLETPVAGVDYVDNEPDWIVQTGTDTETDDELRERISLRWAAIATGGPIEWYQAWAKEVCGVKDVFVYALQPRGEGTVDVVITSVSGAPSPELIQQVQQILDERKPLCADVLVKGPTEILFDCEITVWKHPWLGYADEIEQAVKDAAQPLFSPSENPQIWVGDDVHRSRIVAAAMSVEHVIDCRVRLKLANESNFRDEDIGIAHDQIAVLNQLTVKVEIAPEP